VSEGLCVAIGEAWQYIPTVPPSVPHLHIKAFYSHPSLSSAVAATITLVTVTDVASLDLHVSLHVTSVWPGWPPAAHHRHCVCL